MDKNKHMEAVPTQYNGILFRSKTEAIYARAFDIIGWQWEYEPYIPEWNHNPDFLVAAPSARLGLILAVVEIKPSKPTAAYLKSLQSSAKKWADGFRHASLVFWGNPWDGGEVRSLSMKGGEWSEAKVSDLMERLIEAKNYRFDLSTEEAN